jgi:hypothetical protein
MSDATIRQTKTIHEYFAENPDVDVTAIHSRLYGILGSINERVHKLMPDLEPQPASAGLDYWTNGNDTFEGSMATWTGPKAEHVAHSWIGNRKASILDMNMQVFLSQHVDVPHLIYVFGTIPNIFYYSDLLPRKDIRVDTDYLDKYYGDENADFLELRGNPKLTWSVSHGTYMRALNSPNAHSYTAELGSEDEIIPVLEEAVNRRYDRWVGWLEKADPVPESERAALMDRDHRLRRYGYELDPMNSISEKMLGKERVHELLQVRIGSAQLKAAEAEMGIDTYGS